MSIELRVPEVIWKETLRLFEEFAREEVEGGCLWYAERTPDRTCVALVGVPRQFNRRQNFDIPPEALAELNAAIPIDFEVVAQLHGHPGQDVRHSIWDDDLVVSQRIVSLVLPNWGAGPVSIDDIGVHAFSAGAWQRLDPDGVSQIISFDLGPVTTVATVIDFR